jgi:hypothetical protein
LPARDDPSRLHRRPKPPPVTRLMGTRIEHELPAEKSLLKFIGEQHRGHHLDNGDDRRAIRPGLQAAHITEPYHRAVFAAPVVLAGPASPTPSYSPPTSPLFHPSSTTCWSTAAPPPTWAELDGQRFAATGRGAIGHETVPSGEVPSRMKRCRAAEALLGMARTGGEAAEQPRPAPQRSTVDSPAAPNQPGVPIPLPHAMPVANKHFVPAQSLLQPRGPAVPVALQQYTVQYGGVYFQPAAHPCWSIAPPPPPPAYPYSSTIAPQPPASVRLYYPLPLTPQPRPHAYCGTTTMWSAAPPGALQKKFETLVMCNFTPRRPSELQTSRWVSLNILFCLFQPHSPGDVWLMGPGNLKQLIIKWPRAALLRVQVLLRVHAQTERGHLRCGIRGHLRWDLRPSERPSDGTRGFLIV